MFSPTVLDLPINLSGFPTLEQKFSPAASVCWSISYVKPIKGCQPAGETHDRLWQLSWTSQEKYLKCRTCCGRTDHSCHDTSAEVTLGGHISWQHDEPRHWLDYTRLRASHVASWRGLLSYSHFPLCIAWTQTQSGSVTASYIHQKMWLLCLEQL